MTGLFLLLTISLSLSPPNADSDTYSTKELIMIFRKRRDGWACDENLIFLMAPESTERCQAPVKQNIDFRFKQTLLCNKGGPRRGRAHTWQGQVCVAVQCLFTARSPLTDKRSCVSQPGQLAKWSICSPVYWTTSGSGQGNLRTYTTDTWLCLKPDMGELIQSTS